MACARVLRVGLLRPLHLRYVGCREEKTHRGGEGGRQVSLRLTMFPLRNFDLGTETERARLTSETGRLTAPDNEQRGFHSLESDFRIKEIKERRAVPGGSRDAAGNCRHSFRTQTAENDEASHMTIIVLALPKHKGRDKWRNLT